MLSGSRPKTWRYGLSYPLDFCHLCDDYLQQAPDRAVLVYTDVLGFRYRLCARHAAALTGFRRRRILGAEDPPRG